MELTCHCELYMLLGKMGCQVPVRVHTMSHIGLDVHVAGAYDATGAWASMVYKWALAWSLLPSRTMVEAVGSASRFVVKVDFGPVQRPVMMLAPNAACDEPVLGPIPSANKDRSMRVGRAA